MAETRGGPYAAVASMDGEGDDHAPRAAPRPRRRRRASVAAFLRERAVRRGFRETVNGCDVAYARGWVTISFAPAGTFDESHLRAGMVVIDRLIAVDRPYRIRLAMDAPRFPRLSELALLGKYQRELDASRKEWLDAHITSLHVDLHGHRVLLPVVRRILSLLTFECPVHVE